MKPFLARSICWAILALALPLTAAFAVEPAGRIGYVEGEVFIQRTQGGRPERAEVGTTLFEGDVLVTKNGRAQMALPNAGTVRLGRNSTLNLPTDAADGPRGGAAMASAGRGSSDVLEVPVPVLVAGTSDAAALRTSALSDSADLAYGLLVSDGEIERRLAARQVPPAWPAPTPEPPPPTPTPPQPAPDVSRPVIPSDCTLHTTVWNPEHPDSKVDVVFHIRNNEVTSRIHHQPPPNVRNWRDDASFTGRLEDNVIRGQWKGVNSWEVEIFNGAIGSHRNQGTTEMIMTLNVDGSFHGTGTSSGATTSTYRNTRDGYPQDHQNFWEPRTDRMTGRWKLGGGK